MKPAAEISIRIGRLNIERITGSRPSWFRNGNPTKPLPFLP
jgi:hypothetical protein